MEKSWFESWQGQEIYRSPVLHWDPPGVLLNAGVGREEGGREAVHLAPLVLKWRHVLHKVSVPENLEIECAYKLSDDFAKPYFHKYWTEIHDVTTIWKRNLCSFIVTLNAFDVRPTCDMTDVQAILFSICENMVLQNPSIIYTHPVYSERVITHSKSSLK